MMEVWPNGREKKTIATISSEARSPSRSSAQRRPPGSSSQGYEVLQEAKNQLEEAVLLGTIGANVLDKLATD